MRKIRLLAVFAILLFAAPARAAEPVEPSPAPETLTVPGEQREVAQGNAAGEKTEEGVPEEKAGAPSEPGKPIAPYPGFPSSPQRRMAPSVSPSGEGTPKQGAGCSFLVKFNNADIYEVIHTLGRIAGINYLIDPRIRGVVNVHTQGTVRKEGALDLLLSILRINGATAVREGDLYHIVPMAETKMEPLLLVIQGKPVGKDSPTRPVMRAFPLQYISAAEMAKVLKPLLSGGGDVTEVPRANM